MIKHICDICGKEIQDHEKASFFKIKKEVFSWQEHWWERLHVHDRCWKALGRYIRDRRGEDGK